VVKHDANAGSRWRRKFGYGSERAVGGIEGDLVDHLRNVFVVLAVGLGVGACGGGQVATGDLEAIEKEAGAFGVDLVAGDALEDLTDGELDGGAVVREGDVEAGAAAFAFVRVFDGAAGGVVVVAKSSLRRHGLPQRWPSVKMWRHWRRTVLVVTGLVM
jgi:hypothetical protein